MINARSAASERRGIGLLSLTVLLLLATLATAQAQSLPASGVAALTDSASAPEESAEAPVVVYNRTVAVFRVPFFGVSPENRARRAKQALEELLDQGGPGAVAIKTEPQGNAILIDGQLAFFVAPGDADRLRGETLDAATRFSIAALERLIAETRESRDRSRFLHELVISAAATALFALAVWLTWWARNWLVERLARLLRVKTAALRLAGAPLVQAERLVTLVRWLIRVVFWLVLALLTYRWVSFVLNQFPYTRAWGEQLDGYLLDVLGRIGGGVLGAIPDLIIAVLIFLLARAAVHILTPVFDRVESGRGSLAWLDPDTARPTRRIVVAAIWVFAVVMAYPYLPGSGSEAFKGVSVLIGLMITLGGSSLVGQAASGLILMYSRTVRVGEYVKIGDQEGTVSELGTFTTRIRTGLGEEVSMPNSLVLGNVTKNYSRTVRGPGYIVDTTVTIGYDTPWRQVEAMLIEAARRTPGVLATPAPRVFQTALTDFYPEYRLVCQAIPSEPLPRAEVIARLHANIQDVFNEYGVQIMSPHYLGDPTSAKVVKRQDWYAAPAQAPGEGRAP
jgi:small-conductance mechanosensitive channel